MIEITVSEVIDTNLQVANNLLRDYPSFKRWWTIPIKKVDRKNKYFEFSPFPFIRIGLEEDSYHTNKEIKYKYIKGPFRGFGVWELEKIASKTRITYNLSLIHI